MFQPKNIGERDAILKAIEAAKAKNNSDPDHAFEGGWRMLRAMVIAPDASAVQLHDMRIAYFTGAQHAFACMLHLFSNMEDQAAMESGLNKLGAELDAFNQEMKLRRTQAKGSA